MTPFWILAGASAATVAAAAVVDLRRRRIPNAITVPAMAAALLFHALLPIGFGLGFSLAGLAVGAALLLLPYLLGGGGMGDIKLLAALGAWLGPFWVLVAFACGTLVGAGLTLICLICGKSLEELLGLRSPATHLASPSPKATKTLPWRGNKGLPFAVPLALGTWIMLAVILVKTSL